MAVHPFAAARRVCELGKWSTVTNLALQKILYLSHMIYMGRTRGQRLIDAQFQAWDYGPVEPNLYQKVMVFGDRPIQDIFFSAPYIPISPEREVLDEACAHLLHKRPGELVAMTHWEPGAWAKNYRPGVMGIVIPDRDIVAEYDARNSTK